MKNTVEILLTKKELLGLIEAINTASNVETTVRLNLYKGKDGKTCIPVVAGLGKVSMMVPKDL